MNLVDEAFGRAEKVLEKCIHVHGMKASAMQEGYPQVWARDSMITFLGASLLEREDFKACFKNSLDTLAKHQSRRGYIPLNVDVRSCKTDTFNAGGVDSNLWFIIGHSIYYNRYKDKDFLADNLGAIKAAVNWLQYQDSNECGLLEVHEAADWADLLANRYNVLYDNVLYCKALEEFAGILEICGEEGGFYREKAADAKNKLNVLLWTGEYDKRIAEIDSNGYADEWRYIVMQSANLHYKFYLPYTAFRDLGHHCDALGNCLAVLFDVADKTKTAQIIDYFIQTGMNRPYPIKAIYPPICPGDKDWREYYRCYNLNLPNQYHNGGIWPFIGGFFVAALVKAGRLELAREELACLAMANQQGKHMQWEFNEWINGSSGRPSGFGMQAWSAGMYIFAYRCVNSGNTDCYLGNSN